MDIDSFIKKCAQYKQSKQADKYIKYLNSIYTKVFNKRSHTICTKDNEDIKYLELAILHRWYSKIYYTNKQNKTKGDKMATIKKASKKAVKKAVKKEVKKVVKKESKKVVKKAYIYATICSMIVDKNKSDKFILEKALQDHPDKSASLGYIKKLRKKLNEGSLEKRGFLKPEKEYIEILEGN